MGLLKQITDAKERIDWSVFDYLEVELPDLLQFFLVDDDAINENFLVDDDAINENYLTDD